MARKPVCSGAVDSDGQHAHMNNAPDQHTICLRTVWARTRDIAGMRFTADVRQPSRGQGEILRRRR